MASKPISQREARRMKKRLELLERAEERRRFVWAHDYPGGTHFWGLIVDNTAKASIDTAIKLGHAIVARLDGNTLRLYALKEAERG